MTPRERIDALLTPQARYEELRSRTMVRAGARLCDLGYANAWDGPPAEVRAALEKALHAPRQLDLQYTPYGGATITRRHVARSLPPVRGRRFTWRHVVMTPGAMAALNVVFQSLRGGPGAPGEVVVVTPCWLDVPLYLENLGLSCVFAPVDPLTLRLDLGRIEDALGPATRALVLAQPANPTGLVASPDELRALSALLDAKAPECLLVSDECHRDVVFGEHAFVSPLDFHARACAVYSFGKTWAMQGQRIGYVAVSPAWEPGLALSEELARQCRVMGFATPTSLMQIAVRELAGQSPGFAHIAARRQRAIAGLARAGYDVVPSQATFFLYPRVPSGEAFAFAERMAGRGVLVLPAELFHHAGHFRLSLTATDDMLERALEALAEEASA
jgi:aspartate aminotransferase